jgi:taurine dioxygenase
VLEHQYEPSRIYTHAWQLYDLLIWDNIAVQHARPKAAELAEGRRCMQRVTSNDATYMELVAKARAREARRAA